MIPNDRGEHTVHQRHHRALGEGIIPVRQTTLGYFARGVEVPALVLIEIAEQQVGQSKEQRDHHRRRKGTGVTRLGNQQCVSGIHVQYG